MLPFVVAVSLLAAIARAEIVGDDAWMHRVNLPKFSLGPAPYPHPQQSPYELFGSCYFREDHVEVTPPEQNQKGALWSKEPLTEDNWQTDFVFRVGGAQGDFFGDGFAFWVVQERGHGGDALGGPETYSGVGIFFDTYKNPEFKGKRHPYVYGIINDGSKSYKKLSAKDIDQGCHIPFRNKIPDSLDETEARLTYLDKTLSVVLRPVGSVDWVQCFQVHDVSLPHNVYLGVTAMTGDLVDRHEMIEIKMYNGIKNQPYEYAHENDVLQMPDMWEAMRHSGDVAREFEEWEQDILDETQFDAIEDDYQYHDYYDQKKIEENHYDDYNEEAYEYGEGHKEEQADDEPAKNSKKYKEIQEKRARFENARNKRNGKPETKSKYSKAELESISELLRDTEVGQKVVKMQHQNREKLQMMRKHIEADIQETVQKLTNMVREIRQKEHRMHIRISKLAEKMNVEIVRPLETMHKEQSRAWIIPFVFFLAIILGLAIFGYSRYNKVMKTHLL